MIISLLPLIKLCILLPLDYIQVFKMHDAKLILNFFLYIIYKASRHFRRVFFQTNFWLSSQRPFYESASPQNLYVKLTEVDLEHIYGVISKKKSFEVFCHYMFPYVHNVAYHLDMDKYFYQADFRVTVRYTVYRVRHSNLRQGPKWISVIEY